MSEEVIAICAAILFYPFIVLMIAMSGPHREAERKDLRK